MSVQYQVAIIGAGPAGLSAAARAAQTGMSHILLEASPYLGYTIYRYQKRKHVMAEPNLLPLRSDLAFTAGSREQILDAWNSGTERCRAQYRYNAEVRAIQGERDNFTLTLTNRETLTAARVILAIGLQGNLRKLGVPGEDLPFVQYQLDDPREYGGETIIVVGAGDAAIENAVSLAEQNTVIIINRRHEFSRAKEGNLNAITQAIDSGQIQCLYNCAPVRAEANTEAGGKPGRLLLKTENGEADLACDRIIARLGANPPRQFVESGGVRFPNDDPNSVPAVSAQYESNVPGLYIIGALAGYPLIKQAMNQGYEVVEFIAGRPVEPADEPLLRDKFQAIPGRPSVAKALDLIIQRIPLFSDLTTLQLREFMLDSTITAPAPEEVIFALNDYSSSFYSILNGEVRIQIDPNDASRQVALRAGQFFGEMGLISGRRRSATVRAGTGCVLIETPRRSMLKLLSSIAAVQRRIDETFLLRAIQGQLAPQVPEADLAEVVHSATVAQFDAGATLYREGDQDDSLHLIRRGSVTQSRTVGGREIVLSYLAAGNYVGELALLTDSPRNTTVRAAIATETIRLGGKALKTLFKQHPHLFTSVRKKAQERLAQLARVQNDPEAGDVVSFLVKQGLGEATDVLLIDESLCVHCDNCEKACAETHQGTSRLRRSAGPTYANVHVPTSCRHCEHPHCMKDCPPDAIHRAPNGEVFIADNCIGCGNCERNCPYGVIQMAYMDEARKPSLLSWLLFGFGPGPGQAPEGEHAPDAAKKATKCDMCKDLPGGPACVRACPTGAALRVSPEQFMAITR
jgi:thioredoxin reductase/CRP-like cAMP-binding protein/Fe-S-cluster-containing hydrogenase component 2